MDPEGAFLETAWDITNLLMDIHSLWDNIQEGKVGAAALDGVGLVADLAATILPVVPGGAGTIIKGARAGEKAVSFIADGNRIIDAGKDLSHFDKAAEFGVGSYKTLRTEVLKRYGKGSGLEVHHLIEQRFAKYLGLKPSQMKSIVLTKEEHEIFTKRWRSYIGYINSNNDVRTDNFTKEQLISAAKKIYSDYPEILKIIGAE